METTKKRIKTLTLLLIFAMAYMAYLPAVRAISPILLLTPENIHGPPPDVGQTFTVTLHVSDVQDLWSWKISLLWDPSVLNLQTITEGDFLKSGGGTLFLGSPIDNINGLIAEQSQTQLYSPGQSGSGDLCIFTFKVVGYSQSSSIQISSDELLTSTSGTHPLIPHTTTGSNFILPPPPSHGPIASFTPSDGSYYYLGDTITLDASASASGFDTFPNGGETINPITTYAWMISGAYTGTFTGPTASFVTQYPPGDITVQLTVNAPDLILPSLPSYAPTSVLTKTIHIVDGDRGSRLDIYTERGGQSAGVSSDAYGPQELVIMHGLVRYNYAPVVNKDVSFEVVDAHGMTIAYRTARTDDDGIATTSFRLPWPDSVNPESTFGTWSIKGIVDVSQLTFSDVCPFTFDYIIKTLNLQTTDTMNNPKISFNRGRQIQSYVTARNIRQVPVTTVITVTHHDEASVPICAGYVTITIPAQTTASFRISLQIPSWAYVGTGAHVYADAYNMLPHNLGIPYCPEISSQYTIESSGSPQSYIITASSGSNGVISPSGSIQVSKGYSQTFTITANSGYHISNVLVDGISKGVIGTYTFNNVQADHDISATFTINQYTITASAGVGGSILPQTQTVNYGGLAGFDIVANPGNYINDVVVDSTTYTNNLGTQFGYIFTDVRANHTISATFSQNTIVIDSFAITSPPGATGGTVSAGEIFTVTAQIKLNHGSSTVSAAITPPVGYTVTSANPLSQSVTTNDVTYSWTVRAPLSSSASAPISLSASSSGYSTVTGSLNVATVAATKLVYTVGASQTLAAGSVSGIMTVQRQDINSNPSTSGTITIGLTSTSPNGKFYSDVDCTNIITTTIIADSTSSSSFYYKDMNLGAPTLTASYIGLTSANTAFTITPGPLDHFDLNARRVYYSPLDYLIGHYVLTVTAHDRYNNIVRNFSDPISLSIQSWVDVPPPLRLIGGGEINPSTIVLTNGLWEDDISVTPIRGQPMAWSTGVSVTAVGGGKSGTSDIFVYTWGTI